MNHKIYIYCININNDKNGYCIAGNDMSSVINYFLNKYLNEAQRLEVDKCGFNIDRLTKDELNEEIYDEEMEENISFNAIIEELINENISLPQIISSNEGEFIYE